MKNIQDYENTIKTAKNSVYKVKFLLLGDFAIVARLTKFIFILSSGEFMDRLMRYLYVKILRIMGVRLGMIQPIFEYNINLVIMTI